jgi:nitroreductase
LEEQEVGRVMLESISNPVIQAIVTRRTVRKLKPDQQVSRQVVEGLLEAATWAPNHHLTEPWRFVVLGGSERSKLGEALAEAMAATPGETPSPERLEIEKSRPMSAPVIVAVISSPKEDKKVVPQEEVIAAGAAVQNLLLAAHSLGLGSNIRTGWHAYSAPVRRFLGIKETESLVALVYLGYPEGPPQPGKRTGLAGKVDWRGM